LAPDDPSPEIILAELAEPPAERPAGGEPFGVPFGVPRRFGIGTILVVTTAFGLLLSLLQGLGAPPGVVWFVIVFVSLVGLGQMLLFGAKQPRMASIVVGAICLPLMTFATAVFFSPRGVRAEEAACTTIAAAIFGALFGYLAGGVVAGVFLIMDGVEQALTGAKGRTTEGD
jgi:hypothetical protein